MGYSIWVTADCNLQCKYCYEGNDKPKLYMDHRTADRVIKYILDDYNEHANLLINFHGGEPLLNMKIIKYLVEKINLNVSDKTNVVYSLTTNGTILSSRIIDFMLDNLFEVTLSIDGNKNTQNYLRPFKNGGASFDLVLKNALILNQQFSNLRLRMTFNSKTVDCLASNVIFLCEQGFQTIVPVEDDFDTEWDEIHLDILEAQIRLIKAYIKNNPTKSVSLCERLSPCTGNCSGGISSKHIFCDGKIYPCLMAGNEANFEIGNITTGVNEAKLSKILLTANQENPICSGCDLIMYCEGSRCKIINKLVTGDYLQPPTIQCRITSLFYQLNGIR
ncbi:MAG: radical SAM protein [Enterococcus sp.]